MMKIYISPSNQYDNTYAYGNTNEAEQCNIIAELLEEKLKINGFAVKRAPKLQKMEKSISDSNAWNADLHLSIHTNAGGGSGPLVMVYSKESHNMEYANPIYKQLLNNSLNKKGFGVALGSDYTPGHYMPAELKNTTAIAVYCECEFHDNKKLAKWIIENVDNIATSIAKGICEAENLAYIEKNKKVYSVQVGAFYTKDYANSLLDKAKKAGFKDAFIKEWEEM